MSPSEFADRLRELESRIASERGAFVFFALFMREEVPDRWDLLVSAPWASADQPAAIDYFVAEIKSHIGQNALTNLSRIIIVDPQQPALQALNESVQVEHGTVEIRDRDFFGLPIKQALIITSRRLPEPVAA